jgi:hypothetical protein
VKFVSSTRGLRGQLDVTGVGARGYGDSIGGMENLNAMSSLNELWLGASSQKWGGVRTSLVIQSLCIDTLAKGLLTKSWMGR